MAVVSLAREIILIIMNIQGKLIFATIAVLGIAYSSNGQVANVHTVTGQPIMVYKTYQGVEGSPYFTPDWRMGVMLYNQQRIEDVQIKYNAYEDHIEILYNGAPFLPEKRFVDGFEFLQAGESGVFSYRFKNGFEGEGVTKENYLNVVYEGNRLALAERIKMDQISVTPATYGERDYKEFKLVRSYFLVKQGKVQRFKPSRKNFAKEFESIEPRLKSYFKEHTVDFTSNTDLSELMAFIEETLGRS